MNATATASFAGLPAFLSYFGVSIGLLIAFCVIYVQLTPHREFALIRENKSAATLAFGGSLLGFCLPLHAAITNSVSLIDCVIWGAIALVVQLLAFFAVRLFVRDLSARIVANQTATGGFVAAVSLGVGLLNAASMSY
jgi:putative membrane protein